MLECYRRSALSVLIALACANAQPAPKPPITTPQQDEMVKAAIPRIAQASERFAKTAQQYMCHETLKQRVIIRGSVKHSKKSGEIVSADPQYNQRQILSYYAFTTLTGSPAIHEIRQVLTVDKETEAKDAEGRSFLRTALLNHDETAMKTMLDQFPEEGLAGVATDLGQMILLFGRVSITDYLFEYDREETIAGVRTLVIRYLQGRGKETVHIKEGGKQSSGTLRGWIWVRATDGVPVRITMISPRRDGKREVRDEAEVDYAETLGALLPSMVIHRRWEEDILVAEDEFTYSDWQKLEASPKGK